MSDWRTVTEAEPWLVGDANEATVGVPDQPFSATPQFAAAFPRLAAMLVSARQTAICLPSGHHTLFAWGKPDSGVRAWLCPVAPTVVPAGAAPEHRILLGCYGGVVERFNEPPGNWLLNHNHALTAAEVERDASFLADYSWAFQECGGIPVDTAKWYPAAWEANGNCVLCARGSSELLFFAPDHANDNLVPFGRCPMYTLHTHRGARTLRQWVEAIAAQWTVAEADPGAAANGGA
jgi:hypothetical protein